jgi:predicted nucleic acid-binding protein
MITALDSSVLWTIVKEEPGHELWLQALIQAATEGPLVICPIAFAELAPSTPDAASLTAFLDQLAISYSDITRESAFLAGTAFKRYRQAGGPRQHLVPDFIIAAHAQTQANRLAAIDRGYLRAWFPDLQLLLSA